MPKFFVENAEIQENECQVQLFGENEKHIKTVLRAKIGEEITVCDGAGMDYLCEIVSLEDGVTAKILEKMPCEAEPKTQITLYQGLPKADKMELIIQKCVELGVVKIVPVATTRAIVKLDKKENKKIERWQKIAEAAAKQSGRGIIPQMGERVLTFAQAVQEAKALDLAIIPYEKEQEQDLHTIVKQFSGQSIGIFIGPEGGFAEEEITLAQQNGVQPVTLGKRILRTETAGMTTVAILLYELG